MKTKSKIIYPGTLKKENRWLESTWVIFIQRIDTTERLDTVFYWMQ